jgi:hypothetical protein
MKEFKASSDFVSQVMKDVRAFEAAQATKSSFYVELLGSPLRRAMSGCGVFFCILFAPAVCI